MDVAPVYLIDCKLSDKMSYKWETRLFVMSVENVIILLHRISWTVALVTSGSIQEDQEMCMLLTMHFCVVY